MKIYQLFLNEKIEFFLDFCFLLEKIYFQSKKRYFSLKKKDFQNGKYFEKKYFCSIEKNSKKAFFEKHFLKSRAKKAPF